MRTPDAANIALSRTATAEYRLLSWHFPDQPVAPLRRQFAASYGDLAAVRDAVQVGAELLRPVTAVAAEEGAVGGDAGGFRAGRDAHRRDERLEGVRQRESGGREGLHEQGGGQGGPARGPACTPATPPRPPHRLSDRMGAPSAARAAEAVQRAAGVIAAEARGDLDGAEALLAAFTTPAGQAQALALLAEPALGLVRAQTGQQALATPPATGPGAAQ